MDFEPLVNVIIVTYNQYDYTEKCVESLLSDGYNNKKIICVDNCSDTASYLNFETKFKNSPNIELVRTPKNLGYGGGCNKGVTAVKEGYIVFLNNDTEVEKNWLNHLVNYMEKNPHVGACQPKIKSLEDRKMFEYAGAAGGMLDVFGFPFNRGRIFYTVEEDVAQYDDIVDLVWCSGTCFITRTEVLKRVGGFDESFFMYVEENDLCWRMYRNGYVLKFIPKSIIYHKGMATMNAFGSSAKVYYLHRNDLFMLTKNYTWPQMALFLPLRVAFDLIACVYYLVKYPPNLLSLVNAYRDYLKNFGRLIKYRLEESHLGKYKKNLMPLYKGSIIIDYFIKGRKTYHKAKPNLVIWGSDPDFFGPFQYYQNQLVKKALLRSIKNPQAKLLEVGCGNGDLAINLGKLGMNVIAMDPSSDFVHYVKNKVVTENVKVVQGNAENLDFPKESFDAVSSTEVLEHLPNDQIAVDQIHGVLKQNGIFIFTVPYQKGHWDFTDEWAGHYRRYNLKDIKQLLDKKFRIKKVLYWGFPVGLLWYYFVTRMLIKNKLSESKTNFMPYKNNTFKSLYRFISMIFKIDLLFSWLKLGRNILVVAEKV